MELKRKKRIRTPWRPCTVTDCRFDYTLLNRKRNEKKRKGKGEKKRKKNHLSRRGPKGALVNEKGKRGERREKKGRDEQDAVVLPYPSRGGSYTV